MTPELITEWLREGFRFIDLHRRSSLFEPKTQTFGGKGGSSGIVVTLSTLPSRIGKIFPALNSLLDQTVMPARIILALPSFSRREQKGYTIPAGLRNHPLVTVLPSETDWGPATKLIPALRFFDAAPDTLLLAVDDDNVYPRAFLETFLQYSRALPAAALSLRGWHIPASRRSKDCREFKGTVIDAPVETDIIQGCAGIMVRPRFFSADFFDYSPAPREAFFVDDLWISGHLARQKIPKYVIPFTGAFVYLPSLATLSGPALDRNENLSGKNNDVMIDYFGRYWRQCASIDPKLS